MSTRYYISEAHGSVYSMEGGELIQHPRSPVGVDHPGDSTFLSAGGAVDWQRGIESTEDRVYLQGIADWLRGEIWAGG